MKRLLCPFCAGNELETPTALANYDEHGAQTDDPDGWSVRVVPNKYPAFSGCSLDATKFESQPEDVPSKGLYRTLEAGGFQELIIPSPRHVVSLSELTDNELAIAMQVYRDRVSAMKQTGKVKQAMLFTNCRSAAGASMEHIHSQLIAAPLLSEAFEARLKRNTDYHREHGSHLVHALLDWELEQSLRVVEQTENFTVVCPFASRFAFQSWIIPSSSVSGFLDGTALIFEELSKIVRKQIRRLEILLDAPAYNVLFHLPPLSQADSNPWFVEIFPRITTSAGFELGTDIWINPVAPETACRTLKQVE